MAPEEHGTKILIVDDLTSARRVVRRLLEKLGFQDILEINSAGLALETLKSEDIGLIIADLNMPEMSGLDLLRAVRGDESFADMPFLMITSSVDDEKYKQAIEMGVSHFILKPFNAKQLADAMSLAME